MYENLKEELEKQGIKVYSLAKLAKIVPSDLYQAIKGKRMMYPGWRKRIADVLNVPEEKLFYERKEDKYNEHD